MNLAQLWKNEAVRQRLNSTTVHLLALAALTAYCVATSWRRWPQPLTDFGNDLYRPWRIAHGAVLYRDLDSFYGPLSQYINATIFALFGPGMMHLVWANLVVLGVILATLYRLLRQAWGGGTALLASALFVTVFGFSQSNYTYVAPYSQETTHGMLALLLLLVALDRWLVNPSRLWSFSAGVLFGLTALLKTEFMFAGFLLTLVAVVLRWQSVRQFGSGCLAALATGAVLPTLLFVGYFARHLSLGDSWVAACHVWLNVTATIAFVRDPLQIEFLGFDQPWAHLLQHLQATLIATVIIASVIALAKIADLQGNRVRGIAIGAATMVLVSGIAWWAVNWVNIGRCLLGLVLLYLAGQVTAFICNPSRHSHPAMNLRILFAVLAAALMARMVLNGRIYQFGYYQAAMAGTVVPAVLWGESSCWARVRRQGRATILFGFLALLLPGVAMLMAQSRHVWKMKTYAVGEGPDRFYTFPPRNEPIGGIVRTVVKSLSQQPGDRTLLVLPEGLMLNYLARLRSPLAPPMYFSIYTEHGREALLVDELQRQPPDFVVIISRDLTEYGINRYGEAPGRGQLLLRWVRANYRVFEAVGGDPLDVQQRGAIILQRDGSQPVS
ncbi:MAG TPA: glycosyltransferase family 39 protein [Verrucomicrobiae bacterium]|nr:glycosyltransferase family 39 protein [Verrucomicrobiae bacterium]